MTISTARPKPWMVQHIVDNMRDEDYAELKAGGIDDMFKELWDGVEKSTHSAVFMHKNVPVTVLGVVRNNMLSLGGTPWLISTDKFSLVKRELATTAKQVVKQMLEDYPYLYNYVHARNSVSIRWLKFLGFNIDDPIRLGSTGEYFRKFSIGAVPCVE